MNKLLNYITKTLRLLSLAFARVEKNALSQDGKDLSSNFNHEIRTKSDTVSEDLMQGVVTEEVKQLRYRTYKILEHSSRAKISFYTDSDGNIQYKLTDRVLISPQITGDPFDKFRIEMVIDNSSIGCGISDANEHPDDAILDNPIVCIRDGVTPKFNIEKYTEKLYIRHIRKDLKLLEFYIPKYVDQYDRKTTFIINILKKLKQNTVNSDITDIKSVAFVTMNALGCADFREFMYDIVKLDKVVEYNGYYIVKFRANLVINGYNLIDKYVHDELDQKYANKEARNN